MKRTVPSILVLALGALAACDSPAGVPERSSAVAPQYGFNGRPSVKQKSVKRQLAGARAASARYQRLDRALADGYADIDVFIEGMGYHYLKAELLDANFDADKPELLVYSKQKNGRMRLVAVEYAVPLSLANEAPAGFTGRTDVWDRNETFQLWTLHAWVWLNNPSGVFASHNPRLMPH